MLLERATFEVPVLLPVTSTVTVQVMSPVFAGADASEPPLNCTLPLPAAAVTVPPQVVDAFGVAAIVIPLGKVSVRLIGESPVELKLWIVIVKVEVPPLMIVVGENALPRDAPVATAMLPLIAEFVMP
jgi:hypothetical protein